MDQNSVLYESDGRIATLTLNRPENRNSMTPDVMQRFRTCIAAARAERGLRCLVITGRGSSFCAGADFRGGGPAGKSVLREEEPVGREAEPSEAPAPLPHERAFATYAPFLDVADVEVPTIAAMNGHAIGGGLGLALVCDLRVASREARYGANFARLGFHSGMAISYLLPRLIGLPRANELLLTGRLVDGVEAERLGILNRAVPGADVLATAWELAGAVAEAAPLAVRSTKTAIRRGLELQVREAAHLEAFAQAESLATDDAREGIAALLAKRPPKFTGR